MFVYGITMFGKTFVTGKLESKTLMTYLLVFIFTHLQGVPKRKHKTNRMSKNWGLSKTLIIYLLIFIFTNKQGIPK